MKKLNRTALLLAIAFSALLSAGAANAGQAYLYTMFHDDNSNGERFRTEMESMGQCMEVLEKAKMPMPDSPSGDYEVMGAMWCGGSIQINYGGVWKRDTTGK